MQERMPAMPAEVAEHLGSQTAQPCATHHQENLKIRLIALTLVHFAIVAVEEAMEVNDTVLTSAPAVEKLLPGSTTTQVISHNTAQAHTYQHNGHVYGTLHVRGHQIVGTEALQVSDAVVSGNPRIPDGLLVPRKLAKKRGKNYGECVIRVTPGWTSWFWRLTLQQSCRGWTANLRTTNLVPHDSLIHQLRRQGDLHGVKRLLASGQASALDITVYGQLPFHVDMLEIVALNDYHADASSLLWSLEISRSSGIFLVFLDFREICIQIV